MLKQEIISAKQQGILMEPLKLT